MTQQVDELEQDQPDVVETEAEEEIPEQQEETEEGVSVSFGEESPPPEEDEAAAPEWAKDLRRRRKEDQKRIRELEDQLKTKAQPVVEIGPKPTLESCEYDEDVYDQKLDEWKAKKAAHAAQQAAKEQEERSLAEHFQTKVQGYASGKSALKVKDFDDAEDAVGSKLTKDQIQILIHGASDSATLVYALGRNESELNKLSAIKNPVEFAFAAARLETKLKVTPRKSAPLPESRVSGSSKVAGTNDRVLADLEAKADKTGDRTALVAYRKKLKAKAT